MQFGFVTAPITNRHFHKRVAELCQTLPAAADGHEQVSKAEKKNPSFPAPTITTLTDEDTSLFPSSYVSSVLAYSSPWIDLCSDDPVVANLSRQVLNLEVAYANFCGVRSIIIPGPREDHKGSQIAQYARAIQEAFQVASRVNLIIHMPMYREPGLEEKQETLSGPSQPAVEADPEEDIDLYSAWDSWHTIRTVCEYNMRLFVGESRP